MLDQRPWHVFDISEEQRCRSQIKQHQFPRMREDHYCKKRLGPWFPSPPHPPLVVTVPCGITCASTLTYGHLSTVLQTEAPQRKN